MSVTKRGSFLKKKLSVAHPAVFSTYCIIAAFCTYFCMYAFRKPFTAGTFEDQQWLGVAFKTILITTQVTGYTLSKFIGIKIVSELAPRYRAVTIVGLIVIAEIALLMFAITPSPWNFIWLFFNGLPLGMVFGLVLGFLEGRRVTEALSAGLCLSFILASGVTKSVGSSLIDDYGISEFWMPFVAGLIFVLPLLASVWMLSQIPPPSELDVISRSQRSTMSSLDRWSFFRRHWIGISVLVLIYVLLTIGRSLRDDFGVEIWRDLGVDDKPTVFAKSEFWVGIGVVVINGTAIMIRNNKTAFLSSLGLFCLGFAIALVAVIGQLTGQLSPMVFMVLLGLGLYIPYVAYHTTLFERMLAAFREVGTIGYLMYLADAMGYLGYVSMLIFRNFAAKDKINFLSLLLSTSLFVVSVSSVLAIGLLIYYQRRIPDHVKNDRNL